MTDPRDSSDASSDISRAENGAVRGRVPISVAVLVPTYNRKALLEQALRGLLAQTRTPDRILVIDDGSDDGTSETVAGFGDSVDYLRRTNGGKASALNSGLKTLSEDLVWVFDDDDWPLPDALESLFRSWEEAGKKGFVYSGCYTFSGYTVPEKFDSATYRPPAEPFNGSLFLRAVQSFPFCQNGMLVPVDFYRMVGGYNENLRRGQDYDMIIRLCRQFSGVRLDRPTFAIREHEGVRGPKGKLHSAKNRSHIWLQYDREIFAQVRQNVPLAEYVTEAEKGDDSIQRGGQDLALMRRANVMARHGLLEDALFDVTAAAGLISDKRGRENLPEADLVTAMAFLGQRPTHDVQSVGYLVRLAWRVRELQPFAWKQVLRGAYWDTRGRWAGRCYRDVALLGVGLCGVMITGASGGLYKKALEIVRG